MRKVLLIVMLLAAVGCGQSSAVPSSSTSGEQTGPPSSSASSGQTEPTPSSTENAESPPASAPDPLAAPAEIVGSDVPAATSLLGVDSLAVTISYDSIRAEVAESLVFRTTHQVSPEAWLYESFVGDMHNQLLQLPTESWERSGDALWVPARARSGGLPEIENHEEYWLIIRFQDRMQPVTFDGSPAFQIDLGTPELADFYADQARIDDGEFQAIIDPSGVVLRIETAYTGATIDAMTGELTPFESKLMIETQREGLDVLAAPPQDERVANSDDLFTRFDVEDAARIVRDVGDRDGLEGVTVDRLNTALLDSEATFEFTDLPGVAIDKVGVVVVEQEGGALVIAESTSGTWFCRRIVLDDPGIWYGVGSSLSDVDEWQECSQSGEPAEFRLP